MNLEITDYLEQQARLPQKGRHIVAQYDDECIIVYQAYRPAIGNFAAANGFFGGDDFSFDRMSWIKPNFLWMMYRSNWGRTEGQEVILAVRLKRSAFDEILAQAISSSYERGVYTNRADWQRAVGRSDVRLQWDPDHDPHGAKLERRAIQLGLRGDALAKYGREWLLDIEDISDFVREQRENTSSERLSQLLVPKEDVYPVDDPTVAAKLGIGLP
jgi:hypothetical protein